MVNPLRLLVLPYILLNTPISAFSRVRDIINQHHHGISRKRAVSSKSFVGLPHSPAGHLSSRTKLFLGVSNGGGGGGGGGSTRRMILKIVGSIILSLPLIGELYSRLGGVDVSKIDFPEIPESATEATLLFHGAGGPDQYTDALVKRLDGQSGYSSLLNWFLYSQNILQASFSGQVVGRELARRILQKASKLERIHLIGVSVGAFVADSTVAELKAKRPELYVQQTLLDPFCGRGIIDPGYGKRRFGVAADYAQQYLNTDDPVPNTNEPLPHCVVYDVTSIRPESIFGHDWPLVYYGKSSKVGFVPDEDKQQRGVVIDLKE